MHGSINGYIPKPLPTEAKIFRYEFMKIYSPKKNIYIYICMYEQGVTLSPLRLRNAIFRAAAFESAQEDPRSEVWAS